MARLVIVARAKGEPLDVPDWTLVDLLRRAAREHPDKPAFLDRDGSVRATWSEVEARVRRLALGLLVLGVRAGDRVAVVSDTRAEFVLADCAAQHVGAVSVSVFRSFPAAAICDALRQSRVRFAFVEDAEVLARCEGAGLDACILFEGEGDGKRVLSLDELEAMGRPTPELDARVAALRPDEPAVVLYTSGTTGKPKGAVLTHRNLVASALSSIRHLRFAAHPVGLAFLPLAHSYQRQAGVVLVALAGSVAFSAPARLQEDLPRVRPTLLPAVPRLYERMHERIQETARRQLPHRRRIFAWAADTARAYGRFAMEGAPAPRALAARHAVFEALVYRRIRRMAGLDRCELAVTGAAAMREDLLTFFWGIGLPIVEGYGLTETTAPSTVNPRVGARAGTVGTPMPGTEVAIAEDGEVLLAGPHVFLGYDGLDEETRESFVEIDGTRWLRTGDIGSLENGYLRILDRKKELEVLDTGKKVAPSPIEERLKAADLIAEAVVVAHGRKYVGCLVQPAFERLLEAAKARGFRFDASRTVRGANAVGEQGVVGVDPELVRHPDVLALYAAEVERVNATLADYERIKAFRLLPSALSAERGEITPTLKKRRRAILAERRDELDALFGAL